MQELIAENSAYDQLGLSLQLNEHFGRENLAKKLDGDSAKNRINLRFLPLKSSRTF